MLLSETNKKNGHQSTTDNARFYLFSFIYPFAFLPLEVRHELYDKLILLRSFGYASIAIEILLVVDADV